MISIWNAILEVLSLRPWQATTHLLNNKSNFVKKVQKQSLGMLCKKVFLKILQNS